MHRRVRGRFIAKYFGVFCFAVFAVAGFQCGAWAQTPPDVSPEQVQQLLKNATPEQRQKLQNTATPAQPIVLQPAPQTPPKEHPTQSDLEKIMSERVGQPLHQFGYDQVGVGSAVTTPQTGAVQDSYVLGPGDEIDVVLRGQENSEYSTTVNRNGQVILPKINPLPAAGRTLGEFRQDLQAAIHRAYVSTDASVSVGQLRQVSVLVTGEVANPGTRVVTGLTTPLDALLLSGGVKTSGSLRNIELIRDGTKTTIDLYGILTRRSDAKIINLRDGDRIFVPPIGATVAIAGAVRRPAIYELPPDHKSIGYGELLSLAAGTTVPGVYTVSILRLMPDGRLRLVDVTREPNASVYDSEAVIVKSAVDVTVGKVTLTGAVRTPGVFALDKYPTLHDILPNADSLKPGAYVLFGFIDRIDPKTMQRQALPFSPLHVIQGSENLKLISEDTVHILTESAMRQIIALSQKPQQMVDESSQQDVSLEPGNKASLTYRVPNASGTSQTSTSGNSALSQFLPGWNGQAAAGGAAVGSPTGGGTPAAPSRGVMTAPGAGPASGLASASEGGLSTSEGAFFGSALSEYMVTISGAVLQPGKYLVAPNTSVAEALIAAGGLANDVDLSNFEITSTEIDNASGVSTTNRQLYRASQDQMSRLILKQQDSLYFRHTYSDRDRGNVEVQGEVRYPGTYQILRGERLSSLLMRAGGLTEVAYPYGTVFLRASVAQREREEFKRAAADMRSQLLAAVMRPTGGGGTGSLSASDVVALQGLLEQVANEPALGRMSVIADPAVLAARPDRDPVLQPGDRIVIPARPSSVSVLGEVMQSGAFPFNSTSSVSDYIARAGGFTQFADQSRVIVVLPDGTARVSESSWLSFGLGHDDIPPGSVIVVPRDLLSLSLHQIIVDTTQIMSQLATTAAALAVLAKY